MWIPLELADLDQWPPLAHREALFRAAVGPRMPPRDNHRLHLFPRNALSKSFAEIGSLAGVQTEIPETIGGESAAVARAAKRTCGGGDDTEGRSVGQSKS